MPTSPTSTIRRFYFYITVNSPVKILTMPPKTKLNVQSFPRPPRLEKTPRHLQVKWNDQVIADTTDGYWALETHHPPSKSHKLWISCHDAQIYAAFP